MVVSLQLIVDRQLVSGSDDGTIKVWQLASGDCSRTFSSQTPWLKSISYLGNDQLATGNADGKILIWNLNQSDQPVRTLQGHSEIVGSLHC